MADSTAPSKVPTAVTDLEVKDEFLIFSAR